MKSLTPDRKVQLIIGPVVLSSAALAYFVSIYFIAVAAMIGFGLTRAGATGNCPLENILKKFHK